MTARKIVLRRVANLDIAAAITFYQETADDFVAARLINAVQDTLRLAASRPAAGSPRYGNTFGINGLRTRPVRGFPYLVFYVAGGEELDVWRVLHTKRDIQSSLFDT